MTDDLTTQTPAPPPWSDIESHPDYQKQSPEEKLVTFDNYHSAAYNYASSHPDWEKQKNDFNNGAAAVQQDLSKQAGGVTPDQARVKIAEQTLAEKTNSIQAGKAALEGQGPAYRFKSDAARIAAGVSMPGTYREEGREGPIEGPTKPVELMHLPQAGDVQFTPPAAKSEGLNAQEERAALNGLSPDVRAAYYANKVAKEAQETSTGRHMLGGIQAGTGSLMGVGAGIVSAFGAKDLGHTIAEASDYWLTHAENNAPGIRAWAEQPWITKEDLRLRGEGDIGLGGENNPIQLTLNKLAPGSKLDQIYRSFTAGAGESISSFTTPTNLGLMMSLGGAGATGGRAAAGIFTMQGLAQLPDSIKAFNATDDIGQKTQIATAETLAIALPGAGLLLHATPEGATPKIPLPNLDKVPNDMLMLGLKNLIKSNADPRLVGALRNEVVRRKLNAPEVEPPQVTAARQEAAPLQQAAEKAKAEGIPVTGQALSQEAAAPVQAAEAKTPEPIKITKNAVTGKITVPPDATPKQLQEFLDRRPNAPPELAAAIADHLKKVTGLGEEGAKPATAAQKWAAFASDVDLRREVHEATIPEFAEAAQAELDHRVKPAAPEPKTDEDFKNIQAPHEVGVRAGLATGPEVEAATQAELNRVNAEMFEAMKTAAKDTSAEAQDRAKSLQGRSTFLAGKLEGMRKAGPNYDAYVEKQKAPVVSKPAEPRPLPSWMTEDRLPSDAELQQYFKGLGRDEATKAQEVKSGTEFLTRQTLKTGLVPDQQTAHAILGDSAAASKLIDALKERVQKEFPSETPRGKVTDVSLTGPKGTKARDTDLPASFKYKTVEEPTGRTDIKGRPITQERVLFTNLASETAAALEHGREVIVPPELRDKVNPAIKFDRETGKVTSVDTPYGEVKGPGDLSRRYIPKGDQAPGLVHYGEERNLDFLTHGKEDAAAGEGETEVPGRELTPAELAAREVENTEFMSMLHEAGYNLDEEQMVHGDMEHVGGEGQSDAENKILGKVTDRGGDSIIPKHEEETLDTLRRYGILNPKAGGPDPVGRGLRRFAADTSADKGARALANHLLKILGKDSARIELHALHAPDDPSAGKYTYALNDPLHGKIYLNLSRYHGDGGVVATLLHELVHHVTMDKVRNPRTPAEVALVAQINKARESISRLLFKDLHGHEPTADDLAVFQKMQSPSGKAELLAAGKLIAESSQGVALKSGGFPSLYGLTSDLEFAAEIKTNRAFREKLESLQKGIVQKILGWLRQLIGLKPDSLVDKAVRHIDALMDKPLRANEAAMANAKEVSAAKIVTKAERLNSVPEDGTVEKVGKSDVSKTGLMNVERFRKQLNLSLAELDAYKQTYPSAFTADNVNVRAIHKASQQAPLIHVSTLDVQNGGKYENVSAEQRSALLHKLDTEDPNWRDKFTHDPSGMLVHKSGVARVDSGPLYELAVQYNDLVDKHYVEPPSATERYSSVNPYNIKYLRGQTTLQDGKQRALWAGDISVNHGPIEAKLATYSSHYSNNPEGINQLGFARGALHEFLPGARLPDGKVATKPVKVFEVWEAQTDAHSEEADLRNAESPMRSQQDAEGKRELEETYFERLRHAKELDAETQHPLQKNWEQIILKAAIDQAKSKGADYFVLTDSESAMMTEGHDKDTSIGKKKDIPQLSGMEAAYDTRGPDIIRKVTGNRGMPADMGTHEAALRYASELNIEHYGHGWVLETENQFGQPVHQGEPYATKDEAAAALRKLKEEGVGSELLGEKKNNTGRMWDISKMPEDLPIVGYDRGSAPKATEPNQITGNMGVTKAGEASAAKPAVAPPEPGGEITSTLHTDGTEEHKLILKPDASREQLIALGQDIAKADLPDNVKADIHDQLTRALVTQGKKDAGAGFLGISSFVNKDVIPFVKKGGDIFKAAWDIFSNLMMPTTKVTAKSLDILFSAKGKASEFMFKAGSALDNARETIGAVPREDQIAFVDRIKRGETQPTQDLQRVALLMRIIDDKLHAAIKEFKPDLPYLENHMRVLWKVIPGSPEALGLSVEGLAGKRPWAGSKGFMKKATLESMSEGIALGGIPVTYNPIELQLLAAQDAMKFVAANRAWDGLKESGAIVFVKGDERPPLDYVQIKDSISKVYFSTKMGMVKTGEYWVAPTEARLITNYLSLDHIRNNPLGKGLITLKMATTAIELGVSPFHAMFVSSEAVGSSLGLGLAKIFTPGHFLEGVKDIVTSPTSFVGQAKLGTAAIRFAKDPGAFKAAFPEQAEWFARHYPDTENMIKDLFAAGGLLRMHEDYRIGAANGFMTALKTGEYPSAIVKAIPAINQAMMRPLFETYIPRLKVGMFLRDYSFELERRSSDIATGKITRNELARQTWAFVDDRFGELNWDNLYWDRTFKSAMQFTFRSVTWKLGNVRGFGKAANDTVRELGVNWWKEGRLPRMTLPMGWLIGMSVVTATMSSVITKIFTGKYPWELAEDGGELMRNLIFPRIDPQDKSQRVSVPTYWRDAVHLMHAPPGSAVDYVKSSMSGEIGRLIDIMYNKDFYGREVFHPEDPIWKKGVEMLGHMVPLPFGVQSVFAAQQSGATPWQQAMGTIGFTKAPYYISHSKAEQLASKYVLESLPQGARTQAEYQKTLNEKRAVIAMKRGDLSLPEAISQGLVDRQRAKEVSKKMKESPLEYSVSRLSAENAMRVYRAATPAEREDIYKAVRRRILGSRSVLYEDRKMYLDELSK